MKDLAVLQGLIAVLLLVAVAVIYGQRLLTRRGRRRSSSSSNALSALDEIFSPARHVAAIELQTEQNKGPVTPTPDNGLPETYNGTYVISLGTRRPDGRAN